MITLTITIEQEGGKGVSVTARTKPDSDTNAEMFVANCITIGVKEALGEAMAAMGATKADCVEAPPGPLFEKLCEDVKNRIRKEP